MWSEIFIERSLAFYFKVDSEGRYTQTYQLIIVPLVVLMVFYNYFHYSLIYMSPAFIC